MSSGKAQRRKLLSVRFLKNLRSKKNNCCHSHSYTAAGMDIFCLDFPTKERGRVFSWPWRRTSFTASFYYQLQKRSPRYIGVCCEKNEPKALFLHILLSVAAAPAPPFCVRIPLNVNTGRQINLIFILSLLPPFALRAF